MPIITGITFSNVMMAVHKKITDAGGLPDRHAMPGPSPIAGAQCSPYYVLTSWQNDKQAEVVGKYATDKGYKKVIGIAPNYQAGKDFVAGFKRYYKGDVIDEIYTPLDQPGLLGRARADRGREARRGLTFLPGRPRHQLRQASTSRRASRTRCRSCRRRPPTASTLPAHEGRRAAA